MSTTNSDALTNRLGALALRLGDQLTEAVTTGGLRSLSAATALSSLDRFLDDPTIGQLAGVIGLSSSATVRLIDGLEADGYVRRIPGSDARSSIVRLTSAGRRIARKVVAARTEVLSAALEPLDDHDRVALHDLIGTMLIGLVGADSKRGWMCRLCDTAACGAAPGQPCPITAAALRLPAATSFPHPVSREKARRR